MSLDAPRHNHELNGMVRDWKAPHPQLKLTALVIATYMGLVDGVWLCYPGTARLAEDTGFDPGTIRRHLAELELCGFLRRESQGKPGGGRGFTLLHFTLHEQSAQNTRFESGGKARARRGAKRALDGVQSARSTQSTPHIEEVRRTTEGGASAPPEAAPPGADAEARDIVSAWWDERKAAGNPPAQPYIALVRIVSSVLRNGIPRRRVEWAIRHVPVVSTGAIEFAIQQELERRGRGRPSGDDDWQALQEMYREAVEGEEAP